MPINEIIFKYCFLTARQP